MELLRTYNKADFENFHEFLNRGLSIGEYIDDEYFTSVPRHKTVGGSYTYHKTTICRPEPDMYIVFSHRGGENVFTTFKEAKKYFCSCIKKEKLNDLMK